MHAWLDAALPKGAPEPAGDRPSRSTQHLSRCFMLLAGPGMGKSVFSGVMQTKLAVRANKQSLVLVRACVRAPAGILASAGHAKGAAAAGVGLLLMCACAAQVRHFFKVGQRRAQGKAMVACLAQQLAEQLPGFAAQLDAQALEGWADLSLRDLFERCARRLAGGTHRGASHAASPLTNTASPHNAGCC